MLGNVKLGGQGEPQGTPSADNGVQLHTNYLPSQTKQMLQTNVLIANTSAMGTITATTPISMNFKAMQC